MISMLMHTYGAMQPSNAHSLQLIAVPSKHFSLTTKMERGSTT